jgi:hypothetical protein
MDSREAIERTGQVLKDCLKTPSRFVRAEVENQVLSIVMAVIVTPEESTRDYEKRCDEFLESVVAAKGLPVRSIVSHGELVTTGIGLPKDTPVPIDKIQTQKKHAVETYSRQAALYLNGEMAAFRAQLADFLGEVFSDNAVPGELKIKVTAIKRAFRDLTKWDRFFSTVKNNSFPSAVNRTFSFEGNPLAVKWSYSPLDEAGEFRNVYNHKDLADRVYAIRGNWALEKGLMKPGPHGYVEDVPAPGEEFDCMCGFQFIYNLRSLPESMLTPKGAGELARAQAEVSRLLGKSS